MFIALFSVMLVASEGAASTEVTPSAPIANEAAEAEKKICRRQPVTGQIQGTKRVCMTAEQWKRVREANERRR
ncbi:MAG TPA: hypothetical protein VFT40_13225 [Sphingomicrobium sp.]|jgi:predicted transglutaminase-like cysteine proteinase|nr:hypothetical protein [Sphingomicrobium sp.]